jgi:putative membrane protein
MRTLTWLLRAAIFFVLFAFALNNQHEAVLKWFFGAQWRAPMVYVVLVTFALGCAFGVLAMVPSWWRHRRIARQRPITSNTPAPGTTEASAQPEPIPTHPPREGL